jgi:MFS family permease
MEVSIFYSEVGVYHPGSHRISAFFSCASLSGAFSGILAFGIINMDGVGDKPGWAWIFFLEGLFTFLFGVASFWLLPKSPAHAYFFDEKEKNYVVERLKEDGAIGKNSSVDAFHWSEVCRAFTLPQVLILGVVLFCDGGRTLCAMSMDNC